MKMDAPYRSSPPRQSVARVDPRCGAPAETGALRAAGFPQAGSGVARPPRQHPGAGLRRSGETRAGFRRPAWYRSSLFTSSPVSVAPRAVESRGVLALRGVSSSGKNDRQGPPLRIPQNRSRKPHRGARSSRRIAIRGPSRTIFQFVNRSQPARPVSERVFPALWGMSRQNAARRDAGGQGPGPTSGRRRAIAVRFERLLFEEGSLAGLVSRR